MTKFKGLNKETFDTHHASLALLGEFALTLDVQRVPEYRIRVDSGITV